MIMQGRFTAFVIQGTEGINLRRLIRFNWTHPDPASAGFNEMVSLIQPRRLTLTRLFLFQETFHDDDFAGRY